MTPRNVQIGTYESLAAEIRRKIVAEVPGLADEPKTAWLKQEWFFYVTVGEAYFGLDDYDNAQSWLRKAAELPEVADWEKETTARQMAALLRIKHHTIQCLLGDRAWVERFRMGRPHVKAELGSHGARIRPTYRRSSSKADCARTR
jgi:hypothetical protein